MSQSKRFNKNSFVIQGSILAIAGILVRVIGLIYRIPLTRILGDEGNGYYSTAFDIYNVLLLLSSQSMPLAVSKIVSEKLEKKEYKNANRVFKGSLIFALILGVVVGLFAFFGADWLASSVYKSAPSALALKVLAPTLTVVCVLGVFRGYFQGMGNMVPTAISQIFEQIVNAFVSVFAAMELSIVGITVYKAVHTAPPKSDTAAYAQYVKGLATSKASYGAEGGTMGTLFGAIAALIIIAIILWRKNKQFKVQIQSDTTSTLDKYPKITKILTFTILPVLLSTTIYNISNLLDNPIFQNIMHKFFHMSTSARAQDWGIYSAKYRLLTTMPIAIAAALSTAMVPSLVRSYVAKNKGELTNKVNQAFKFSMMIAFPCGVGLSVLGLPINKLLFGVAKGTGNEIAIMMLFSVLTVVAFSLSTISNAILQGIDHLSIPIKNSAISLGVHLILLPIFLIVFKLGIYGVVIGDITFAALVCVLNAFSIKKYMDYKHDFKAIFIKPFISALVMGAFAYGSYLLLSRFTNNIVSTIIAIVIAVIVYGILLIRIKGISEEEILDLPKGASLVKLLKKIKLI
ncbi:MAG: polysaccharide biosynthesis protein [Eubacterium sp.]|nr:polysaccharide biosynthesis protein [Eubacterium sp.]